MKYYTVRNTPDGRIILSVGTDVYIVLGPEEARRIAYSLLESATPECDKTESRAEV